MFYKRYGVVRSFQMSGKLARGFVERMSQVMGGVCPHHCHDPSPLSIARLSGGSNGSFIFRNRDFLNVLNNKHSN